jgi:drug/metabolite transporter (DMT)-like permease
MGIFPSAVAYATWAYTLSRAPLSNMTSFLYLVPGVAILIGWSWLGEAPEARSIAGGLISLCGVAVVNKWGKH